MSRSRLDDPERLRVVVERQAADGLEPRTVPHVLGVVPRADAEHELAVVVRVEGRRRREAGNTCLPLAGSMSV